MPKVLENEGQAGGHEVAGAVVVRASGRRRHPRPPRRDPRRRRRRGRAAEALADAAGRRRRGAAIRRAAARQRPSAASGDAIEVDAPMDAAPSVLFDAVVLPDGADAVASWPPTAGRWSSSRTSTATASRFWCSARPPSCSTRPAFRRRCRPGNPTPVWSSDGRRTASRFEGVHRARSAKHRHFERETDPPLV